MERWCLGVFHCCFVCPCCIFSSDGVYLQFEACLIWMRCFLCPHQCCLGCSTSFVSSYARVLDVVGTVAYLIFVFSYIEILSLDLFGV
jgi:hypothetical protein